VVPTGCQNKGICLSWFIRYISTEIKKTRSYPNWHII
jgi:hypothetical protein